MSIEWYNMTGSLFKKAFKDVSAAKERLKEITAMDMSEKSNVYKLNVQAEFAAITKILNGE